MPFRRIAVHLEPTAISRKVIVPWYDADGVCMATMIFLLLVLGFAAVGIVVARQEPSFNQHLWMPTVLAAASPLPLLTIGLRLFKRRQTRR